MFTRNRPIGGWNVGAVSPDEFEKFDDQISKAIDGDGGGAYAPTTPIAIGGAGLQVDGNFNVVGPGVIAVQATVSAATFLCPVVFDNASQPFVVVHDMEVIGQTHLIGDVTVDGALTMTGSGTLSVNGLSVFSGIAGFQSVTNFNAQVNCGSELNVTGTFGVAGAAAFGSTMSVADIADFTGTSSGGIAGAGVSAIFRKETQHQGALVLIGAGRVVHRVGYGTINGSAIGQSQTFSVLDYDIVRIAGPGTLLGLVEWKISQAGIGGDTMILSRQEDTSIYAVRVVNEDGSLICILGNDQTAGPAALIVRDNGSSGKWSCVARFAQV